MLSFRRCVVCGKEFKTVARNVKYCSEVCRRLDKPIKSVKKKICPICGKEFETTAKNVKYCSKECRLIGKRRVRELYDMRLVEERRKYHREYKRKLRAKEKLVKN